MDEIIFRSSQKLENLQVKMNIVASQSKDVFHQYSQEGKATILRMWNGPYAIHAKHNLRELWHYIIGISYNLKHELLYHPRRIYRKLIRIFWRKWTTRDICFMTAGFLCGAVFGLLLSRSIRQKATVNRYMQAIQCTNYLGIESASVVEIAPAPYHCSDNEILIDVKAGSIQLMDTRICRGYGRNLRRILRKIYKSLESSDLPVTLGRDCTGIIVDIGRNVKRFEVGDEVWLTVPFWHDGTLSQTVLVAENFVGKKPKNIGFEGACSLPYAGTIALNTLQQAGIDCESAQNKRILIIGGCTPVGCVLIQVLKYWNCSSITTTCYKRAVPVAKALGSTDIVVFPQPEDYDLEKSLTEFELDTINAFLKELELRDQFDTIILTRDCGIKYKELRRFCKSSGILLSTLPKNCPTDNYGVISNFTFELYLRFKHLFEVIFGIKLIDCNETHMCYGILDEINRFVEDGHLQTVVDKVYHPQDIEIALNHVQSHDSIGSTIITFR